MATTHPSSRATSSRRATATAALTLLGAVASCLPTSNLPCLPWLPHDLDSLHACRRGFFETHVTDWLADEKLPDLVRQKWLDMWTEVDSGLGSRLKAEVAGMTVC